MPPTMTSSKAIASVDPVCSQLQLRLTYEGWWILPEPLAAQLREKLPERLGPEPDRPGFGDPNKFWEDTSMGAAYRSPATPVLIRRLLPNVSFTPRVPPLTLAASALHVPRIAQSWFTQCDVDALSACRFGQVLVPSRDAAFAAIADLTTAFPGSKLSYSLTR